MKKNEVKIGGLYKAKVSGRLTEVRITAESRHGGWDAINVLTNKMVRIKSPQRLRGEARHRQAKKATKSTKVGGAAPGAHKLAQGAPDKAQAPKASPKAAKAERGAKDGAKRMSGLDAAAKVLEESGDPMTTRAMFDAMVAKGYWSSDAPTPHNTLYSAILREMTKKGEDARFHKAERGKFALKA